MFRRMFQAALLLGGMVAAIGPANAENRVALVIGQSAYRAVTPLPNPANDAKAMSQALAEAGFEVISAADLSQRDLNERVSEFAGRIAAKGPDTVALVFYAGHGMQIDGENYLVPVDVDPKREADIPLQAVRLNDVLNTLNSVPSKMRVLLLDACRNNPFPAVNTTAGRGLALVDTRTGAPGTFLSYSTSPGAEAEDGNGANSPYTSAFLNVVREPGLPIEDAFKRVRVAVNKATEGRQTPWESSSLTDNFYFIPGAAGANASIAKTQVTRRSVDEWKRLLQGKPAAVANEMVVADGTDEAYEAFILLYTERPFAPQAREWLDRHRRMTAWKEAVMFNTVASYRSFLDRYPNTDLTVTALRLIERLRYRPSPLPVVAAAAAGPVSAGPTCPCNAPAAAPTKKVETPPRKREAETPRRAAAPPPTRPRPVVVEEDEVVVVRRPPPPPQVYQPAPPPVGIGIGIGIGGGIVRGGGYDGPVQRQPMPMGRSGY